MFFMFTHGFTCSFLFTFIFSTQILSYKQEDISISLLRAYTSGNPAVANFYAHTNEHYPVALNDR